MKGAQEATFNKLKQKQNASGGRGLVAMKKMNTSQGIFSQG
jgi:hypothetical protein